jgi:triphosphoribosyl-dephospho-CoA synthase
MKVAEQQVKQGQEADLIAGFAVQALLEEVYLTPKPGLVDLSNNGSHHDLNLSLMETSAIALKSTFKDMALAAIGQQPSLFLREQLAAIGRYGEQKMLQATGNINTHKGAIWCIGLLTAATSTLFNKSATFTRQDILDTAGVIASFNDRYMPEQSTNGCYVRKKYPVISAREQAVRGFPALRHTALPEWDKYDHEPEEVRRLNVLLALMTTVDDTCILYRSNMNTLRAIQRGAKLITANGGLGISKNWVLYHLLDQFITKHWVSPGGSADLLAATIFIHKVSDHFQLN